MHLRVSNAPARQPDKNRSEMAKTRDPDFAERLGTAAKARKAHLENFKAKWGPNDPGFAEREAARQAISQAREARAAERKAARLAAEAREAEEKAAREAVLAAEQAAREAALEAERIALEAAKIEAAAREAALEIERKAERDARYAARKARGRKK
jgi:hypothetical protein